MHIIYNWRTQFTRPTYHIYNLWGDDDTENEIQIKKIDRYDMSYTRFNFATYCAVLLLKLKFLESPVS